MLFEPVVGVALAAWLLQEALAPIQILGAIAILRRALLLQRSSRPAASGATEPRDQSSRAARSGYGATAMPDRAIRVLLVDDHAMVRRGMRDFLGLHDDIEVVGEAADGAEAVEQALCSNPTSW